MNLKPNKQNIIFITLLLYAVYNGRGTVLVNPTDTWVIEGQNVTLYCEFEPTVNSTSCFWTRNSMVIIVNEYKEAYSWLGDYQHGNCSLIVLEAELERDEATWKCQLPATASSTGDEAHPAKLQVYVEPSPPALYHGYNVSIGDVISIWDNETLPINCATYHSNPKANMWWELDNSPLDSNSDSSGQDNKRMMTFQRTITVNRKFNKDDNGKVLRCLVKHETLNSTIWAQTQLNIQYSTTSVEILSPNYVQVDIGSGYSFVCKADGNPSATCEWLYKGSDNPDWVVLGESCQFELESATVANAGQYMCLAGNNNKKEPSPVITFDIRDGTKNIVGIIAGVFGALLIVAVVILAVVVVRLRRRIKNKRQESVSRLPSLAELNRIEGPPPSRGNTYRDTTYMIPVPNELAPLRPPIPLPDHSPPLPTSYRDKPYEKRASDRQAESNIYSEPHFYEEILAEEKKALETDC